MIGLLRVIVWSEGDRACTPVLVEYKGYARVICGVYAVSMSVPIPVYMHGMDGRQGVKASVPCRRLSIVGRRILVVPVPCQP